MAQQAERRGRGEPAGITRRQIVEAAREMEPSTLTMQALAERLGVRRGALNYHIADRTELFRLVAVDAFEETMGPIGENATENWREAVRSYARRIRDAVLATGQLVDYFRYRPGTTGPALQGFEDFIAVMTDAGFEVETAGRTLQMVADYAMAFAKDVLMSSEGEHPQHSELRQRLESVDDDQFLAVRQVVSLDLDLYGDQQFDFAIETMLAGLEFKRQPRGERA